MPPPLQDLSDKNKQLAEESWANAAQFSLVGFAVVLITSG